MLPSPTNVIPRCSPAGVDVHVDRQTRPQRTIAGTRLGDSDANGHSLDDFGEVSGRVVRRQQREFRSRRPAYARDSSLTHASAVGVDLEFGGLTRTDFGELS